MPSKMSNPKLNKPKKTLHNVNIEEIPEVDATQEILQKFQDASKK